MFERNENRRVLVLTWSVSRSQQFRYGKLALGSAPSFAFTALSPDHDAENDGDQSGYYGATGEGESYFDDEYLDENEEEAVEGDGDEEAYEDSHFTRRSSGFFFSDPVHDSSAPTSPTHQHGPGHGQHHNQSGGGIIASSSTLSPAPASRVRRSFGPGLFTFTPTPSKLADQSASAITFDDSIVHDVEEEEEEGMLSPTRQAKEGTPLLAGSHSTPVARRRSSAATALGRTPAGLRRASEATAIIGGAGARRFSESRRSVRSRARSIVLERGESTDGQTVSGPTQFGNRLILGSCSTQ